MDLSLYNHNATTKPNKINLKANLMHRRNIHLVLKHICNITLSSIKAIRNINNENPQ